MSAEAITVDLKHVLTKAQLLDALGEALELGGPTGNVQVRHSTDGRGWGKNWDALNDSLAYLDAGGIWGISRKPAFPLELVLMNSLAYREADPTGWATLLQILEDTRASYAKRGLSFGFRSSL